MKNMKHITTLTLMPVIAGINLLNLTYAQRSIMSIRQRNHQRRKAVFVEEEKNRSRRRVISTAFNTKSGKKLVNEYWYRKRVITTNETDDDDFGSENFNKQFGSGSFLNIINQGKYRSPKGGMNDEIARKKKSTKGEMVQNSKKVKAKGKLKAPNGKYFHTTKEVNSEQYDNNKGKQEGLKTKSPKTNYDKQSYNKTKSPKGKYDSKGKSYKTKSPKSKKSKEKTSNCYTYVDDHSKGKSNKKRKKSVPCSGTFDPTMTPTPKPVTRAPNFEPTIATPSPSQEPRRTPVPTKCRELDCERPTNPTDKDKSNQPQTTPSPLTSPSTSAPTRSKIIPTLLPTRSPQKSEPITSPPTSSPPDPAPPPSSPTLSPTRSNLIITLAPTATPVKNSTPAPIVTTTKAPERTPVNSFLTRAPQPQPSPPSNISPSPSIRTSAEVTAEPTPCTDGLDCEERPTNPTNSTLEDFEAQI